MTRAQENRAKYSGNLYSIFIVNTGSLSFLIPQATWELELKGGGGLIVPEALHAQPEDDNAVGIASSELA